MRLIDADTMRQDWLENGENEYVYDTNAVLDSIDAQPAVDAVEVEKYNDLREAFVDFVCSGVHNPAPYCKNACDECVDAYGWCTYRRCNGFNPDGERKNLNEAD